MVDGDVGFDSSNAASGTGKKGCLKKGRVLALCMLILVHLTMIIASERYQEYCWRIWLCTLSMDR